QQIFRKPGAFEHDTHEHEQRDCNEDFICHHAEYALRQGAEERQIHDAKSMTGERKQEREAAKREGDRITSQQQPTQCDHHGDGEKFRQPHQRGSVASTRAARIASAAPCSSISSANSGIRVLSKYRNGSPLASRERSRITHARDTYGSERTSNAAMKGSRNSRVPSKSIQAFCRAEAAV